MPTWAQGPKGGEAPLGPPWAPWGGPRGPLGPPWAPWGPLGPWEKPLKAYRPRKFENLSENILFGIFGSKMGQKKVWIQAPGPPRRDPGRNSASDPGLQVPNGGMAIHLVAKMCDLGYLGVPGPASTPLGRRGRATSSIDPKLDLDLDISDLGFDQISSHKRGGCRRAVLVSRPSLTVWVPAWIRLDPIWIRLEHHSGHHPTHHKM